MNTKTILISALLLFCTTAASAQIRNNNIDMANADSTAVADSAILAMPPVLDSTLLGTSIYGYAEQANVRVNRTPAVDTALKRYITDNFARRVHGYRIRLFFDNKQSARNESEKTENLFKENFPTIPVYRSYVNPYFKVVAGDYRTKSDAMRELSAIREIFPNAFIIKEYINFPQI